VPDGPVTIPLPAAAREILGSIGINRFTLLNRHAALSENLMADPEASGRLRRRPVEIGRSVYTPPAVPQVIEEMLDLVIRKAAVIGDPFERSCYRYVVVRDSVAEPDVFRMKYKNVLADIVAGPRGWGSKTTDHAVSCETATRAGIR
jgi:hypothetical protein